MTTKALISFAVTEKLICVFFVYVKRWFSHDEAQMEVRLVLQSILTPDLEVPIIYAVIRNRVTAYAINTQFTYCYNAD